jgi:hypothetical protein
MALTSTCMHVEEQLCEKDEHLSWRRQSTMNTVTGVKQAGRTTSNRGKGSMQW